ncbi:hypothetical protein [Anaerorhabdus sp.]|uniref:hypothetical protein n=1 Tax=Anaerorhabdus sp. TaxID=1872524 RepID=UPI002FC6B018
MNKYKKINIIETIFFIVGWIIIFLLGADFPPPSGFWKVVLVVILLAIIQSIYLKYLFKNIFDIKSFLKNTIFFFVGGLLVALCSMIILPGNHGNNQISIIWIALITSVCIVYGILFWFVNYFLQKNKNNRIK